MTSRNNIDWSERMEEAGCRVLYGFEDYKVHSKLCLITYRNKNEIRYNYPGRDRELQ